MDHNLPNPVHIHERAAMHSQEHAGIELLLKFRHGRSQDVGFALGMYTHVVTSRIHPVDRRYREPGGSTNLFNDQHLIKTRLRSPRGNALLELCNCSL